MTFMGVFMICLNPEGYSDKLGNILRDLNM